MFSAKEKAISCKTLICFIQSLIDEICDLELKNDLQITGQIISVDSGMNIELKDVKLRKPINLSLKEYKIEYYDYLYLKGEKIRYVQFSDQIDVKQNIENKLDEYHHINRQKQINTKLVNEIKTYNKNYKINYEKK